MSDSTKHMRAWRARNPEKSLENGRKSARLFRQRHPELLKARKKAEHLRRVYGLTVEAFASMFVGQGNRCAICRTPEGDWVVDHDHHSGDVRGILCRQCNIGLGAFKDNPECAIAAAKYLMAR